MTPIELLDVIESRPAAPAACIAAAARRSGSAFCRRGSECLDTSAGMKPVPQLWLPPGGSRWVIGHHDKAGQIFALRCPRP